MRDRSAVWVLATVVSIGLLGLALWFAAPFFPFLVADGPANAWLSERARAAMADVLAFVSIIVAAALAAYVGLRELGYLVRSTRAQVVASLDAVYSIERLKPGRWRKDQALFWESVDGAPSSADGAYAELLCLTITNVSNVAAIRYSAVIRVSDTWPATGSPDTLSERPSGEYAIIEPRSSVRIPLLFLDTLKRDLVVVEFVKSDVFGADGHWWTDRTLVQDRRWRPPPATDRVSRPAPYGPVRGPEVASCD